MPLPTGTWKANVDGVVNDLLITAPAQNGIFTGIFFGVNISGFWDEISQTITFTVNTAALGNPIPSIALYKGFLFRTPLDAAPGVDVTATLAGFMQVTPETIPRSVTPEAGSARRNIFGWFAQILEVL